MCIRDSPISTACPLLTPRHLSFARRIELTFDEAAQAKGLPAMLSLWRSCEHVNGLMQNQEHVFDTPAAYEQARATVEFDEDAHGRILQQLNLVRAQDPRVAPCLGSLLSLSLSSPLPYPCAVGRLAMCEASEDDAREDDREQGYLLRA